MNNWGPDVWRLGIEIVHSIALLALWIYAVMTRRSKDNEERLEQIDADVGAINLHLVRLEGRIDAVPDHDDLEKLHTRISEVKNQVGAVGAEVSGTAASVRAIERNLELLNRSLVGKGNG